VEVLQLEDQQLLVQRQLQRPAREAVAAAAAGKVSAAQAVQGLS
jgi:hypothetical protein